MVHISKATILAVFLSFSLPGHAINKCTDASGRVSFQDKPCSGNQESKLIPHKKERDSSNTKNLDPIYVQIPGVGNGVLFSYKWWNAKVIQPSNDLPPIVKMTSKAGEEPISFTLSFIPNKSGKKISLEETADTVSKIGSRYVAGSIEKEVNLKKLDTTIGPAIFASFNEQKYQNVKVPEGEYSSITVGQASHSKIVVGFTVLTHGTTSKALTEAFNIIGSFQIVADR
jgi:hypothetical protein